MKRLILLAIAISFVAAMFYNVGSNGPKHFSDVKETGNVITNSRTPFHYESNAVLDTTGRVPGLTGFYDYYTNGNNLHRIWVSGDTVIVTVDQTDSANCQISTARRSFYQYTTDNGITWGSDAILVNADGSAYPNLHPMIVSGSRTAVLSGRQFVAGARRGYVGVDVILGAGSFTNTLTTTGGSLDNFAEPISATELGCGWLGGGSADTVYYAKFNVNTNTYGPASPIFTGVPANGRTFTAANGNNGVSLAYWNATAPTSLRVRSSTDGGTTFGAEVTAITEGLVVNGTAVAPWFNADMIYKPGTTNLYMAFGTLETGNFGTTRGYKLMVWSPGINGGQPVRVADYLNYPPMADTNVWNERTRNIQVGMTAMSHAGLAFSNDGSRLFVVYSGMGLDTVNSSNYSAEGSYNYNDIYVQYSDDQGATWTAPRNLTNTPDADEIYPSISRVNNTNAAISITYALSECPGSTSFTNTTTPRCKVYQIYKKYNPETGGVIGIQNVSSEVPAGFSLQQNYPNPFNPNTKIRFSVPKSASVTVAVYDVTGKLVATLANNEFVTAGVKEINFNAANLASGIYFYTLKAGDFSQTKKMILVK
ncbi:MAG: T9SS type A sorting domain-containing protein [Ignavibacteria bacterium]|nr:T9SS type A sorting domain-containing protein [Ignavibacteria bacterium]